MFVTADGHTAFMHIPKCAGTSIRHSAAGRLAFARREMARDLALAPDDPALQHDDRLTFRHPALGPVKLDHLPLWILRDHFPGTYASLLRATGFSILRPPRERFLSGLVERLYEFEGVAKIDITARRLAAAADETCRSLEQRPAVFEADRIHNAPQHGFVELEGRRLVGALFTTEDIVAVEAFLAPRIGPVAVGRARVAYSPRPVVAHCLAAVRPFAGIVRPRARGWIREVLVGLGLVRGRSGESARTRLDADVERFIETFYRRDFELYEIARGRAPHSAEPPLAATV